MDYYERQNKAIVLVKKMVADEKSNEDIQKAVFLTYGLGKKATINIIEMLQ